MRILAFETTGMTGSVAALVDANLQCERPLPPERRSAQTLAASLRDLLAEVGWRPADVELIAVAVGPGSFTGLRVGVVTAKMLAYAIGCPVIGVNSLAAIASRAPRGMTPLSVVMEAQRGEVFVGRFAARTSAADTTVRGAADVAADRGGDAGGGWLAPELAAELDWIGEAGIESAEAFLASLAPGDCVTGSALETLADRAPAHARVAPRELWSPSAAAVGLLGWRDFVKRGVGDDPFQLTPLYLRRTAAEEQWERRAPM